MTNFSLLFPRLFFFLLSLFLFTAYKVSSLGGISQENVFLGLTFGTLFGAVLFCFDWVCTKSRLRVFNLTIVGLFIGYLMGQALTSLFTSLSSIPALHFATPTREIVVMCLFLFGTYLGIIMTFKASDQFCFSIPFIKLHAAIQKRKNFLLDESILLDTRIIDLANTRLLDHQLILPIFIKKELASLAENGDEIIKMRAKKGLEVIKKLESLPFLGLSYNEIDFPDIKSSLPCKLFRLARLIDANILSAEATLNSSSSTEDVKIINLQALSNALKPLTQTGEYLNIKVQRLGKELDQGVGYLDDGSMVVINRGGRFLGKNINVQVLSVKHSSTGRIIFCNSQEDEVIL